MGTPTSLYATLEAFYSGRRCSTAGLFEVSTTQKSRRAKTPLARGIYRVKPEASEFRDAWVSWVCARRFF